jgi:RNA polymerase sigma-70 factor (ECF subfamily)
MGESNNMESIDELFLLSKLKEGDIKALEVIFNKHYGNLCLYLLLLFKNELLVEHIAQDIFIYLWEKRETIEIKTSLESYLYTAGRYKALNQIRDAKRHEIIRKNMFAPDAEYINELDSILEVHELKKIIEEAINTLPARCQQIFRLSREEDLSYKEIAELLNVSVNTVEGQMAIALKKLRTILKPFYFQLLFLV